MPTTPTPTVPRNEPCPCGSGKKYKHCCGRTAAGAGPAAPGAAPAAKGRDTAAKIFFGMLALLVGTIVLVRWIDGRAEARAAGLKPKPWEYNAELNQHFDPNHGHWHVGLPPSLTPDGVPITTTPLVRATDPVAPAPVAPKAP
jgi:hypothetical protein